MRFDQLTSLQKLYLRAMAEADTESVTSGEVAALLDKKTTELGAVRSQLLVNGLIYSPSYGEISFTVPLFGGFIKRAIP